MENRNDQKVDEKELKASNDHPSLQQPQMSSIQPLSSSQVNINKFSISNINSFEVNQSSIDKQNNIRVEDSQLDFVSIDDSYINKPANRIFDDICSICSRKIFFIKFICTICTQCTLCSSCEESHLHPVIKFKQNELSTLEDVVHYVKEHQMKGEHPTRFFATLFKDKYSFQLQAISQSFSMRRNQEIKLPIAIENTMNFEVTAREVGLVLFAKKMKDLMIRSFPIKNTFGRKEKFTSFIDIRSGDFPKLYDFTLELYSATQVILESNVLNIKIEVNDDEEDEKLNVYFKDCIQVKFLDKDKKRKIKEIVVKKTGIDNPILIKNILEDNNWDLEKASKQIALIDGGNIS